MRFEWFTVHQFQKVASYVDSLIVKSHTPMPLDVATPQSASLLIADELASRVQHRFVGRTLCIDIGAAVAFSGVETVIDFAPQLTGFQARYGVLIGDRMGLHPVYRRDSWLVFDWYRWVLSRVDERRIADAWMYMCVAHTSYRNSSEFSRLGLPAQVVTVMQSEGDRLLDAMATELSRCIREIWSSGTVSPS